MNLESELFTLQDSNSKLVAALHEANANVEQWKKQLTAYQEETERLRDQVRPPPAVFSPVNVWFSVPEPTPTTVFRSRAHVQPAGQTQIYSCSGKNEDVSWAGRLWLKALIKHTSGETSSRSRSTRRTSSRYRPRPHEDLDVNRSCFHLYRYPILLGTTWPPANTAQ